MQPNNNQLQQEPEKGSSFSQMQIEIPQQTEEDKAKLDASQQAVSKRSGKKKKVWNIVMFLINVCVIAGIFTYQIVAGDFVSLTEISIDVGYLFVCIALVGVALVVDTGPISYLINKACKRPRFALSFKTNICGRYYDAITPLAAGGQPFQVTYLRSRDVPATPSLSIPMAKLFFEQLVWFIICTISLIVSFVNYSQFSSLVNISSYIGFVLTFAMLFLTIFLSVSKNVGKKLVAKTLKLLQKMKIVKNYEKQYQRVSNYVEDYQNIMRAYVKNKKDFIVMFLCMAARIVLIYSLPFFIYCTFNGYAPELYWLFMVMGVLIDLASSFIPLPGGTGMNEVSYVAMFAPYFADGALIWAMLLWRFFTYYLYLILGFGMITYDVAYGNRKYRWMKVERRLQLESKAFKEKQISSFRTERAYRRTRQLKK